MDSIDKTVLSKRQQALLDEYHAAAKSRMGPGLTRHMDQTLQTAQDLARIHMEGSSLDLFRLYAACILHDIAKPLPIPVQAGIVSRHDRQGRYRTVLEEAFHPVLHSFCAYYLLQEEFGIRDRVILEAVRCHTVGRPDMNLVDTILYVSDKIEEGRDFGHVAYLRECSLKNINLGLREVFKNNIIYIIENHRFIYPDTCMVWNNICKKYGGFNGSG